VSALQDADRINFKEPMIWVGKAQVSLFRRKNAKIPAEIADLEKKAMHAFDNALQGDSNNVPALLGRVNFATILLM
jgi:hypothetical protein